ncbi:MAG: hypothetical protein FJ106_06765 [Deltaproteobacteria bacterium]|nr:hypothetical protein [Deltaproteobacteria bacterium]
MERRAFIGKWFSVLALGGILFAIGCDKKERPRGFGNQERLWQLAAGQGKPDEPLTLAYAKETPGLFRDASMAVEGAALINIGGGG